MASQAASYEGQVRRLEQRINELEKMNSELRDRVAQLERENKELREKQG
jgi:phage shock protein A